MSHLNVARRATASPDREGAHDPGDGARVASTRRDPSRVVASVGGEYIVEFGGGWRLRTVHAE